MERHLDRTELLDDERPVDETVAARPYRAVVTEVPGADEFRVDDVEERRPRSRRAVDTYATDIPIAIVAALLGAATFLPWYKGPAGFGITVTGWASGTWGPLILFLAAGSLALVVLRRVGVAVSLPVEESLFHEGGGWISLVGAVVKSRFRPGQDAGLGASYGLWVAIGLAVVLIILAGRMSPHAPLVFRPGWQRARSGIVGIVVLAIVVAGSAVFGATNKASLTPSGSVGDQFAGTVHGKIPDCAKDFPLPTGLTPDFGFGTGVSCQAQLTSKRPTSEITAAFRALFRSNHFVFTENPQQPNSTLFFITRPKCSTVAVVPSESGSIVVVALSVCAQPTSK